jgi:hypothetical protein
MYSSFRAARLAMSGGSAYLLRNLPSNAEPDLSSEVRSFAGTLDTIAMKLLAKAELEALKSE